MTANDVWYLTALHLLNTGKEFNPKDLDTREHVNFQTAVPMSHPFVTYKERKLGYKFMAAEAATILIGGNTVASLKPFSRKSLVFLMMDISSPVLMDRGSWINLHTS